MIKRQWSCPPKRPERPDHGRWKPSQAARRTAELLGLCALLVLSSLWGAEYKSSRTVSLPVLRVGPQEQEQPADGGAASTATNTVLGSFTTYRLEMDAAREQSLRMLDALIADEKASPETVEQARAEKLALAQAVTAEAALEGLLAARGYGESYVTVRKGSVNVVVKNPDLTAAQTASILEMVTRETGEDPDNVKIIPAK